MSLNGRATSLERIADCVKFCNDKTEISFISTTDINNLHTTIDKDNEEVNLIVQNEYSDLNKAANVTNEERNNTLISPPIVNRS